MKGRVRGGEYHAQGVKPFHTKPLFISILANSLQQMILNKGKYYIKDRTAFLNYAPFL